MPWLSGFHAVETALKRAPQRLRRVLLNRDRRDQRVQSLVRLAATANVEIEWTDERALTRALGHDRHQGAIAEQEPVPELGERELEDDSAHLADSALYLVLDEVSDPRNFGALIRVADGAGADGVITTKHRSAPTTDVVHQASAGASLVMPIYRVTNLARSLRGLKDVGIRIIGFADESGQSCFEADLTGPIAIVVGAEGEGMRRLTRESCDVLVRIPMLGAAESLNVSVAAGIALYECVRQRA